MYIQMRANSSGHGPVSAEVLTGQSACNTSSTDCPFVLIFTVKQYQKFGRIQFHERPDLAI